jgi:hypothetical protein
MPQDLATDPLGLCHQMMRGGFVREVEWLGGWALADARPMTHRSMHAYPKSVRPRVPGNTLYAKIPSSSIMRHD